MRAPPSDASNSLRTPTPRAQATEVCAQNSAQFTPQLEAAARRQTRKRARLRHDAATAAQEGIQWAAALAVRAGDLDAAKQVAIRVKHDAAAALLAYAQWCVAHDCECLP